MRQHDSRLLEDPIGPSLLRLAGPMVLGLAAIILFNVVDTFYVGRLGAEYLAAMSFTFPVVVVVMSLAMGVGIGVTSVVSRAIGHGDEDEVRRLTTDGLILANVVVITVALLGLLTIEPVFRSLGASEASLERIKDYMVPYYLGVGFLVIPMVGNSAIRATGDTKTPSIVMIIAGVVNVVLDPLLIFGLGPFPRLELQGAAIATVGSYTVAFFAALWMLTKRENMIEFKWPGVGRMLNSWKRILHVGLPAAGTNVLVPISAAFITRLVAGHGEDAVAALGVGTRLESLGLIGISALSMAVTPLVGQNFGAGRHDRIKEAVHWIARASLLYGLVIAAIYAVGGGVLGRIFSDHPAVQDTVQQLLWIIPISYGLYGFALMTNSVFNAMDRPAVSAGLIVLRLFGLLIPLAYIGSMLWDLTGIFLGMMASNALIGVAAFVVVHRTIDAEAVAAEDV